MKKAVGMRRITRRKLAARADFFRAVCQRALVEALAQTAAPADPLQAAKDRIKADQRRARQGAGPHGHRTRVSVQVA